MNTVRLILPLATKQCDVKHAFMHGDLEEEIYMKVPLVYRVSANSVCKLKKKKRLYMALEKTSQCGLRDSQKSWKPKGPSRQS